MAATNVGTLTAKLTADISGFTRGMAKAQAQVSALTSQARNLAGVNRSLAATTGGMANTLSKNNQRLRQTAANAAAASSATRNLTSSTKGLAASTAAAGAASTRALRSTRALTADLGLLGRASIFASTRMAGVGHVSLFASAGVGAFIALPIASFMLKAAKAAIEFEESFALVRKTLGGRASETQLQNLSDGLLTLSTRIPVAATELAELAAIAGQMGVAVEDIEYFTQVVAEMGVATNLAGERAAFALARLNAILGTTDRHGVQGFRKLGDAIVHLGNNLAATESEIADTALVIAGMAKTVGLTEPQVLGLAAGMRALGRPSRAGATAVQRAFIEIEAAVSSGGTALVEFSRIANKAPKEFAALVKRDPVEALLLFLEGLRRVRGEGENVFATLKALGLGTQRTLREVLALSAGTEVLRKSFGLANEGFNTSEALAREAGERFKTTGNQLKLLGNQANVLAISFGNHMEPAIRAAVHFFRDLLAAFTALSPATQKTILVVMGLTGAIVALTAAAAGLQTAFGTGIARAFGANFISLLAGGAGQVKALRDGIGLLGGALGGLGAVLSVVGTALKRFFLAFLLFELGRAILEMATGFKRAKEAALEMNKVRFGKFFVDMESAKRNITQMDDALKAAQNTAKEGIELDFSSFEKARQSAHLMVSSISQRIGELRQQYKGIDPAINPATGEETSGLDRVLNGVARNIRKIFDSDFSKAADEFDRLQGELAATGEQFDMMTAVSSATAHALKGDARGITRAFQGIEFGDKFANVLTAYAPKVREVFGSFRNDLDATNTYVLKLLTEGEKSAYNFQQSVLKAFEGSTDSFAQFTAAGAEVRDAMEELDAGAVAVAESLSEMSEEARKSFEEISALVFKPEVEDPGKMPSLGDYTAGLFHNTDHLVEFRRGLQTLADEGYTSLAIQLETQGFEKGLRGVREALAHLEGDDSQLQKLEMQVAIALQRAKVNADKVLDQYPANFEQKIFAVLRTWEGAFRHFIPITNDTVTAIGSAIARGFESKVTEPAAIEAGKLIMRIQQQLEDGATIVDFKPLVDKLVGQLKKLGVPPEVISSFVASLTSITSPVDETSLRLQDAAKTIEGAFASAGSVIGEILLAIAEQLGVSKDKVEELRQKLVELNQTDVTPDVNPTGLTDAWIVAQDTERKLQDLDTTNAKPNVTLVDVEFKRISENTKRDLSNLDRSRPRPRIEADPSGFNNIYTTVTERIRRLISSNPLVRILARAFGLGDVEEDIARAARDRVARIYVRTVGAAGAGTEIGRAAQRGEGALGGLATRRGIRRYAAGGEVPYVPNSPYKRGVDSVPSLLQPGEFVLRKAAVDALGLDIVQALNSGATNKVKEVLLREFFGPAAPFHQGGFVPEFKDRQSATRAQEALVASNSPRPRQAPVNMGPVTINVSGVNDPEAVARKVRDEFVKMRRRGQEF